MNAIGTRQKSRTPRPSYLDQVLGPSIKSHAVLSITDNPDTAKLPLILRKAKVRRYRSAEQCSRERNDQFHFRTPRPVQYFPSGPLSKRASDRPPLGSAVVSPAWERPFI